MWLSASSDEANRVERVWKRRLQTAIEFYEPEVINAIRGMRPLSELNIDFYIVIAEHAYASMYAGLRIASMNTEVKARPQTALAASPFGKLTANNIPKNFGELRKWYDTVRKKKDKRLDHLAKQIKRRYLKKCQEKVTEFSDAFRKGEVYSLETVREMVRDAAKVTTARADMIVQTETTNYYNNVRVAYYNESPDIDYYLFMAIRDQRTTAWCKTRHGLVYTKDTDVFAREKPACHYGCRSEVVPLVRFNPAHKKIINDESRRRENNSPVPLLPGWTNDKDTRSK